MWKIIRQFNSLFIFFTWYFGWSILLPFSGVICNYHKESDDGEQWQKHIEFNIYIYIMLYTDGGGKQVTTTLVYKNINFFITNRHNGCEREIVELLRLTPCCDSYIQSLVFSCFFHDRLIQSWSSTWAPSALWAHTLLTANFNWPLGSKTSVLIYFSDAYSNSHYISAVAC